MKIGRHLNERSRLVSGLSLRRAGFRTRPVRMGFGVHKVALDMFLSPSTSGIPCQYHSTNAPYSFICHRRHIMSEINSVVK